MTVSMREARTLCSSSELQLVRASTSKEIEKLTPARLGAKVDRARKLRDKFRDLARQQRREARGKSSPRGARASQGNDATRRKEQLFAETLERFEQRLAAGAQAETKQASRKKASKKTGKKAATEQAAQKQAQKQAQKTAKKTAKKKSAKKASRKASAAKAVAKRAEREKTSKKKRAARKAVAKQEAKSHAASLIAQSREVQSKLSHKTQNRANMPKIHGHVSSRGRRRQAKRDSR